MYLNRSACFTIKLTQIIIHCFVNTFNCDNLVHCFVNTFNCNNLVHCFVNTFNCDNLDGKLQEQQLSLLTQVYIGLYPTQALYTQWLCVYIQCQNSELNRRWFKCSYMTNSPFFPNSFTNIILELTCVSNTVNRFDPMRNNTCLPSAQY